MYMRNRLAFAALALLISGAARAQTQGSFAIDFPRDSPVTVASGDWGQSRPAARGGALVLDLHTALSLKNTTQKRIRGVTLLVLAQEVTPGGKASVSVPSLDVAPGETFPVRIDLRLLRPLGGDGALVRLGLDGVLFDDLTFYGPNTLNSRRSMMVWELEAQRDRRFFKQVLAQNGPAGLQNQILASMARMNDRGQMGVQVVRGPSTNVEAERQVEFAFLDMPDSPLEALSGSARVSASEARNPRVEIKNRSSRPIRYMDMAWIVKDHDGRTFLAGSVPSDLTLGPGQRTRITQETSLRFSERTSIASMLGVVSHVEFEDGKFWIPRRAALEEPRLRGAVAPSPEEQRLVQLVSGLAATANALVAELGKF